MTQWRLIVPLGIALALWAVLSVRPTLSGDLFLSNAADRPCHPTAAERASAEMAFGVYPTGTPTPTPVTFPVVTTELAVIVEGQDIPLLLPSLVIHAPVDQRPELDSLLGDAHSDAAEAAATPVFLNTEEDPHHAQLS